MSDRTQIEWTDATWNPVTGCSKVSPGCEHCYAERLSHRFGWTSLPWTGPNAAQNVRLHPDRLGEPLGWRKPRKVFVCSMGDQFHEQVDEKFVAKVFAIMALTPHHTYQVLTKRPERMARLLNDEDFRFHVGWFASQATRAFGIKRPAELPPWPYPHVWLGVSAEDQRRADERIPLLLETPAAVRFVSCEPLLGPVDLSGWFDMHGPWNYTEYGVLCSCGAPMDADEVCTGDKIDWVIVGGESGPGARPMHPDWVRSIRDQCQEAGVPFFFKQWGEWFAEWREGVEVRLDSLELNELVAAGGNGGHILFRRVGKKRAGRLLDGRTWDEMPRVDVAS